MDSDAAVLRGNPLQFKEVRQAINMAFSRQEMLLFLRSNRGIAATGGVVPPAGYRKFCKSYGYDYNPEKLPDCWKRQGLQVGWGSILQNTRILLLT